MAETPIDAPSEPALVDFITAQRWYRSKSREIVHANLVTTVPLTTAPPRSSVALVEVRFQPGTHEIYQVILGARPSGERSPGTTIDEAGGTTFYEGLADPAIARELVELMKAGAKVSGAEGTIDLRLVEGIAPLEQAPLEALAVSAEQSNSSVVFDDALILKVYRRLEAGMNPELELLRFLTVHGFANIAALRGWYEYTGPPLDATLGILQDYARCENDGWEFALDALASVPDEFVAHARRLGEVTGAMHIVLASDPSD